MSQFYYPNQPNQDIPDIIVSQRRFSTPKPPQKHQKPPIRKLTITLTLFCLLILLILLVFSKTIIQKQTLIQDLLAKQQETILKLDQLALTNQNINNQLQNIVSLNNKVSALPNSLPNNIGTPIPATNYNPQQTQLLKLRQERIKILQDEIAIKRKNQNKFRSMMSTAYIEFQQSSHLLDMTLMNLLLQYYSSKAPQSIVDLGCGKCQYVIELAKKGYDAKGFDGTPYIQNPLVQKIDLSQKQDFGRKFDYVQTFEVGEHIYSDFEDNFIYNIANHAKKGIVMSWSIVGQGGFLHINNRDNSYIIEKIQKYGFKYNRQTTDYFKNKFTNYFKGSLMVFDKINP